MEPALNPATFANWKQIKDFSTIHFQNDELLSVQLKQP